MKVEGHTSSVWTPPARMPTAELLGKAKTAELLNRGKKTVILAGRGALGAGDMIEGAAARLAAHAGPGGAPRALRRSE